jgi:hypothetical protein
VAGEHNVSLQGIHVSNKLNVFLLVQISAREPGTTSPDGGVVVFKWSIA